MNNAPIALTTKTAVGDAVADLAAQLASVKPRLLAVFAAPSYEMEGLAAALKQHFGSAQIFGCTTAGEIGEGRMLNGAIVAMALTDEHVEDVLVVPIRDLSGEMDVDAPISAIEKQFGQPIRNMSFDRHVGLVLVDGLSGAEERLMEKLGSRTDARIVGGSAGDDLAFHKTWVIANGEAVSNAAALAWIKPRGTFHVLKTQSFKRLDKKLLATKVDEAHRTVIEFNGEPAAVAYAKAIGMSVDDAAKQFGRYPVGLMVGSEPFVRSPQRLDGQKMVFYCSVRQGMELSVLEATDMVGDMKTLLDNFTREHGAPRAMINFHCILRTLQLKDEKKTEAYGKLFASLPCIGFSTYGEQYAGHINQTSTLFVLS